MTVKELQQEIKQLLKEGNITEDTEVVLPDEQALGNYFNLNDVNVGIGEDFNTYVVLDYDSDDINENIYDY